MLLHHVYRHRCLRTDHIISLIRPMYSGTYADESIKRRLRELYDEQYLDLPPAQRRFFQPGLGNPQNVYALGNKGADVLQRSFDITRGKIDWSWKNRNVQEMYIEHTLLEADIMVALELACRENSSVRLLYAEDILSCAPAATQQTDEPFKWKVNVDHEGKDWRVPVEPDKVFALEFSDMGTCAYFFVEADRGTMTVEPRDKTLSRASIYRKLVGYYATWQKEEHTRRFDIASFRVLFVTTKTWTRPSRVQNIIECNKSVNGGKGWSGFLAADIDTLFSQPILEAPWLNGKGELTKLTD